jgi:hypothetical protein
MIDRATLLEHLAQAERHVAQGEAHIGRQQALIADLDRDGHDTKDAVAILAILRETQNQHLMNVQLLLKELQRLGEARFAPSRGKAL